MRKRGEKKINLSGFFNDLNEGNFDLRDAASKLFLTN